MRTFLMTSVAAGVMLLAACQRQEAPADVATAPPVTEAAIVDEPATPEAAVQSAQALDQSAAAAGSDVASYEFDDGAVPVRAAHDPRYGLRLAEGQRTYFYRPGEGAPYLVRDGDYSYAYRDGRFTGATDRQGRRVDDRVMEARRRQADEALSHARDLRRRADDHAPPAARDPRRDQRPGDTRHDDPRHDTTAASPPAATPAPPATKPPATTPDKKPDAPHRDRSGDHDAARSGADKDRDQVSDREDHRPRDPSQH